MSLTPPQHVAIIMDGNGRWAKQRGRPRSFGHRAGRDSVDAVIRTASTMGIQTLSLFAFSTENWTRPEKEVRLILELIQRNIAKKSEALADENIRMRILGSRENLSNKLLAAFERAEAITAHCTGMEVIFAFNYSGHWAIVETAKNLAKQIASGQLHPNDINASSYEAARPMPDLPPVDLLIRSSGEMRISNFHLWEMAYAELYFTDTLWPDFDAEAFQRAISAYHARERRFGTIDEPSS
ncbi:polyprenyl diphosphate synthase [Suttonella ornithocola]|uniref:Ditrans,polycis-undecaprenyl-diphosphate synthase ((2E,6E)-farnesyl-diphosphate specific) n=1 Tax=Suttonella ornithocola TaxID=279832 RepID=A0A380MML8_9GAMM|nr:polyprenyl diphosphate synthase [Suttonella ornithocola]SUO93133.1 Undecaprenyl pyrophosphate synthase [Suttonella ornithocola]